MTVGKLKEYLNDIDDNVEIKGLLLRCENGYTIQSKMRWIDNEDIIAELDKIKKEIRENVFCYDKEQIIRLIIDKHISELNGTHNNP